MERVKPIIQFELGKKKVSQEVSQSDFVLITNYLKALAVDAVSSELVSARIPASREIYRESLTRFPGFELIVRINKGRSPLHRHFGFLATGNFKK
jgi:hypothetical protein